MAYGSARYNAYNVQRNKKQKDISQVTSSSAGRKNNGGLLGGLGYVGGSIAAGIGGIGEGILDLGAAGIALLGGDKEYAKYVFKDNVVGDWHQSLTEDYNPGKVMQFIGDVGQGLGQSATMLIPYVGPYAFFTGVISQGISGAAEKTGDVGFKEVAYGVTSGIVEGTLELALSAAGQGAKSIASAIAKRGGKGAAKTLFSTAVRRGLAGKILSSAAGEFLEEAASEVVDVGLQRLYRIDPNASTSLKDVLYAGIIGAVSGGIMGGSVNVVQTLNNRATGRKIVQDGNAQTLINTANLVADKLAGQGTNFRKAPEWVKTLRGEIDAYNKLVEKGEQNSAKGETILGELQASLFFAETQAVASGLAYSIQQSSEENRATLAEYVNQTIPKNKRTREYTAEDIAKDTDGITMQLAILQFAGNEFINYADAIASLEADEAQEGAIGDVVGEMQQESAEEPSPSTASTPLPKGEAVQDAAASVQGAPSVTSGATSPEVGGVIGNQANAGIFDASAGVSTEGEVAKSDLASPLTDAKYSVATAKRAQKRVKENAARAERARQARLDEEGRMVEGTIQEQSAERKNEPSPSTSSDGATSPIGRGEGEPKIRKPKEEILTDVQRAERAKERAKKLIEYEATVKVTSKELNTAREYIKDFDNLPKGARQAVIKMIRSADGKVDKKILAGVANLMTMRRKNGELVMPDLELRFAEGIVDGGLYTHIGEGENRRVLILINSDADFKETIRGTIAHEIVHYIENRKGYRELADYVLKTAKKEKIAEIEKEYNEHYKAIYAEEAEKAGLTGEAITKKVAEKMATEDHKELIKSEVVAKLIGLRLNNEKFLQRYAQKDDAMIKKIFRFLRASVSYLKDKDKATADEVRELVLKFDEVIKGNVTSESEGTKTAKHSFAGVKAKTADKMKLATAKEMIENGVDRETVRKETGWFKGYDGKWRFEIDDSDIKLLDLSKLAVEDEGLLHDLETNLDTHVTDTIVYKGRLKDVIEHPALFKAYPELKDVSFYMEWTDFSETGYSFEGYYTPLGNQIYIDKRMAVTHSKKLEAIKNTPEYKKYQNAINDETIPSDKWFEMVDKAEKEFFSSVPGKQYKMLQYKDDSKITELSEEGKRVLLHEIQHAIQNIEGFSRGASTTESNYEKAAGEIEARDVANRADMTAEQRKNTRPDLDRDDVVFSESSDKSLSIAITEESQKSAKETVFGKRDLAAKPISEKRALLSDAKYSISMAGKIAENTEKYNDKHGKVDGKSLEKGIGIMKSMASLMKYYLDKPGILPPDVIGKTAWKNGSYGRTMENTTLCLRTLTYEYFKDEVAKAIGRPLTVSESLLASQKIYDIATYPQCIYCYVAADRKSFDAFIGEYVADMDKYIKLLKDGGDDEALFEEYLHGRKPTDAQKKRWAEWKRIAKSGEKYISAADINTRSKRNELIKGSDKKIAAQVKDAQRYAQSASWAKSVSDYVAYGGDILKFSPKMVEMLNSEYGLRMYSFSDYTPAFIVENMQMVLDASVRGLKVLSYTKDADYVRIFSESGMAINMSCFARWDSKTGTYVEDSRQGMKWEEVKELRKKYKNAGAVMVVTNDKMLDWALAQDWIDVVIPYHIVKTGTTIAGEYQWRNYTRESADYAENKTANIYPTEHNNDFKTFRKLVEERGITPRFKEWYDKAVHGEISGDTYMKLVNEVRLPASKLSPVKPSFNLEAAMASFGVNGDGSAIEGGYVDLGGYMGNWFKKGVDVEQEVKIVAEDIESGKSVADVSYGRQSVREASKPVIKRDLAPRKADKAEKKIEKLEKEKAEAQAKAKQERSMREKLAREAAQVAKAEAAKVYTKKEIEAALKDVEALTNAEILSLAKGLELKGMTKARRDELISKIYTLLHSASARGEAGRGSVAVKMIASKIAWDVINTAKIFDENGKAMHIVDIYDSASVEGIATYLTDTLYNSFANMGEHTSNSYFQAEMRKVKEDFNREFINDRKLQRFTREASFQGTQLRQLAETQKRNMEDEGIQKVTKLLGSIVDNKGNIRIGKVDEAMAEADRFYSGEGGKLYSEQKEADKATLTEFAWESDGDLQFMIEEFIRLRKGREGKFLNATEMEYLAKVMGGLKTIIKRYNKAFIDGKWVDIEEKALESAEDLKKYAADREYKNKFTKWLGEKADKYLQGVYFYNILTPETVVETLEGFKKNGVLKTLYHTVRVATQKAEHLSVQLKKPFAEFIDDKKNVWEDEKGRKHSYRNKLNLKTVSINGAEITLGEAIYLYMLTKREQAHAGLTESGYVTYDDEGKRKLKIKIEDIERTRDMIAAQLDATDREFLKMAEEFFNKTSTDIKYHADMEIFGYSNVQEGFYVPIIRDRYSRMQGVTDQRQSVASIITVYNKSFNQNTVENAKALEGQNILRIINDHADGLADYSELYLPLKSFDRVYNRKLVLEGGEITSIREILNNEVWTGAQGYFKKLFADIQGQGSERGFLDGMVGKLRSGWVNSVLGANVKVVATQTTSYVAANQLIEAKYLSAAASKFVGNIDEIRERAYKYSDIIEARNFEMGSLRAQGNIDKVNEIGKKSGFLIGWMDERICLSIFHAAELKAEAQGHGAVGTESNSIAAAKIADEVIYTTQAMTSQAERSALQRSKSEVARTLAMFTSDSVKQLSHLYHNVMQFVAHKQRAKSDTAYEAELSKDAKMIGRSVATVLTTGIMLGLITQAFKYLYAQEEEEPEEKVKDFALDMVSSTLNIMPIVSDIADKFVFGYDLSLNVFDIVNDTIEDTSALFKMTGKAMGGQYVSSAEVGKNLINAAKTYTTLFGVPLAPVERTVTGLMRRFTPSAVYGYDAMFKNPSYTADLQRAVENGNERLAEHILGQLYRNEVTGVYTSEELEIVADLYSKGYTSVIPQRVGETINDVKLDRKQRQQFNKIYSQASPKIMEMIATAEFKALSEEQQAKAIKNLYSLYYNRAASTVAGKEVSNAQMYSWFTDNYSALFTSQAYKGGLDVVKNDKGKEVSVRDQFVEYAQNLGLSESDLLVVEFANGVRDKKTRAALIEHINTLTLSDEQKAVIAEKLSLEVKDGKLVEKKE